MKKLLLSLMAICFVLIAAAENYTTGSLGNNAFVGNTTVRKGTFNDVTWDLNLVWKATNSYHFGNDGTKGFQIGSSNAQLTTAVFSTEEIEGTITSVKVNGSIASSGGCNVSVKVGGVDFTYNSKTSVALTTTATAYEFKGEGSGKIEITYTNSKKKATYIKQIDVVYVETSGDLESAGLSFPESEYVANLGEEFEEPALTKKTTADATYESSNPAVATVNATTGEITPLKAGKTTITATVEANDTYDKGLASYLLTVKDPNAKPWVRVADANEITTGVPYVISGGAYNTSDKTCAILSSYSGTTSAKYFNVTKEISLSEDKSIAELPEPNMQFVLEDAGDGKFYFKSDEGYISHSSGNSAVCGETKDALSVEFDDVNGYVTINKNKSTSSEVRYLVYNASSSRFAFYTTAPSVSTPNFQPLRLYYQEGTLVAKTPSQLAFDKAAFEAVDGQEEFQGLPQLINPLDIEVEYSTSDIEIGYYEAGDLILGGKLGTATITVSPKDTDTYTGNATFTLTVVSKPSAGIAYETTAFTAYEGEDFDAPQLVNPNNVTIVYTSSNDDVAMVDENDGLVVIAGLGTATITATFAGDDTYSAESASYTITVVKNYDSVAKFLTAANNETITVNCPLTVGAVNGNNYYVTDNQGGYILIYKGNKHDMPYEAGDVIPSGWQGQYTIYNGLPELKTTANMPASTEKGEYVIEVISGAEVKLQPLNKVVKVNGVTFDEATPSYNTEFTGVADDVEINFYNGNKLESVAAGVYNVTFAVSTYERNGTTIKEPTQYVTLSYDAVPTHPIVDVDGESNDLDETTVSLNNKEKVVVTLAHNDSENHTIFHKFVADLSASNEPAAQTDDENDGFKAYTEPIEITEAGTLHYYAQHNVTGAKSATRTIVFTGNTTSISEINAEATNSDYYDLSGRMIAKPTKGIVILKTGSKVSKYVF
ncbi:MAG: Ig-like domain-containing protein [Bacteroides sp.]|nr:Ig-like domain-containing protein [Bacteroides sp.]MCM1379778.1 Ig-like domain-containing protein [Bacteroides sp.]MCM1445681.1 Ig-like domain-containing protein [Prevotella sp.]